MRAIIPLFLFAGLLALLYSGLALNPREIPSPLVGKPAVAFIAELLSDPSQRIDQRLLSAKGPSLFNVWASWCAACLEEHGQLLALARRGVIPIYGLNYKDERSTAQRWLARLGDPYAATVFDPNGRVGLDWGVYGVPETFLIDQRGIIRHKYIGPLTPELVEKDLLPRLAKLRAEQ